MSWSIFPQAFFFKIRHVLKPNSSHSLKECPYCLNRVHDNPGVYIKPYELLGEQRYLLESAEFMRYSLCVINAETKHDEDILERYNQLFKTDFTCSVNRLLTNMTTNYIEPKLSNVLNEVTEITGNKLLKNHLIIYIRNVILAPVLLDTLSHSKKGMTIWVIADKNVIDCNQHDIFTNSYCFNKENNVVELSKNVYSKPGFHIHWLTTRSETDIDFGECVLNVLAQHRNRMTIFTLLKKIHLFTQNNETVLFTNYLLNTKKTHFCFS